MRGRRGRAGRARRRGDVLDAHRAGAAASRRRSCSPATGCRCRRSKHDDLAGLDLKGKIVVLLTGGPSHDSRSAARALSDHALGVPEEGRRDRRHLHPEPEGPGHPVGSLEARALHAVAGDRRSRARRDARPAGRRDDQPGAGREVLRRIRPHVQRDARAVERRQGAAAIRDPGVGARQGRDRRARRIESDNVIGILPGTDPALQQRVRRRLRAPRSRRRRRADQRRRDLQRRDGQRVGHRDADRDGGRRRGRGRLQAIGDLCGGHRRGEGAARLALLRERIPPCRRQASSPTSTPTCSCRCFR